MATIDLNHLRAFLDVDATGSFSEAAKKAGVPRSTVSRAIVALERSVGAPLFYRTTRKVTTTAAGQDLAARVRGPLGSLEASLGELPDAGDEPAGVLRVTSTVDFGTTLLAPAVARFVARYPRVKVELHLANEIVDLVGRGFDLAVRVLTKPPRDSSLVARRVGSITLGLYASPAYLSRRGTPRRAEDLEAHDGVRFGPKLKVTVPARVDCDDMLVTRELLRADVGIGALPSFLAEEDVARGALVRVLPSWELHHTLVYVVVPGRRHANPAVVAFRRLLVDMLRARER